MTTDSSRGSNMDGHVDPAARVEATAPPSIAIDARPLAGPPCGYTVYLESLLAALRHRGLAITLLTNRALLDSYPAAAGLKVETFGRIGDIEWEQRDLPAYLDRTDHELYLNAANRGIPLRKNRRTRYLLVLYDVIPYIFYRDYFGVRRLLKHRALIKEAASQLIAIARADAILTISAQSAQDIRRIFRRRAVTDRLLRLSPVAVAPAAVTRRQFVYVGGTDFRKRVDVLLRAFARVVEEYPDCRLVLVGWNYDPVRPLIDALGLADRVTITGYVDDATKIAIMRESIAMVYPSLYEGYGLAIAEGMQARIPVIAGTGGSQRQIGGDGVRRIDPTSDADIAQAMIEMLDPATRQAWIARGATQIARLTDPAIETALVDYFCEQAAEARANRRRP